MRSALRGSTAAAAVIGLLASSVALAMPVVADPAPTPATRTATTAKIAVTHTPYVGRYCSVGVKLTTAKGQLSGRPVVVQARTKSTAWKTVKTVKTKKSGNVTVKYKASRAVQFRAHFLGTGTYKADWSSTVTCTPKTIRYGSRSATVKTIQKKLKALHVRPASTSGVFDANTQQAIYAYQKSRIFKRTGVINGITYDRIMSSKKMTPSSWCKAADKICIDLSKQAGYLKVKGVTYTIPISSGGGYYFYNPQSKVREFAKTPKGTFKVYYKVPGATTGPLGTYYWISFFKGGYGVHGSASVPTYAASHGCVREPRSIEKWIYKNLPIGSQVHIHA